MKRWSKRAGECGQSILEFILVLPIILIILMAGVEISWYFLDQIGLEHCVKGIAENINGPDPAIIGWENKRSLWNVRSGGRKPDWLTWAQQAEWSFDDYDGWFSFGEPWGTNPVGTKYYRCSGDRERDFKDRITKEKRHMIDSNKLSYKVRGGWYVRNIGTGMPSVKDPAWKGVLKEGRMQHYYVDVTVEVVYKHKPLSVIGRILLGADSSGYCELKAARRFCNPIKEVWLQ